MNRNREREMVSRTGPIVYVVALAFFLGAIAVGEARAAERVSVDSAGNQVDGDSRWPSISADGRYVAFHSNADTLVAGDTNGVFDIFVHDRQTRETTRVSVDSAGNQGDNTSITPAISADGQFVAFRSDATNLVAGDTNGVGDIFVHDRMTGQTTRVSVDSAGTQGDNTSISPSISADGQFVAFASLATNLVAGDTNAFADIFVHDRQTGETTRVSVDSAGIEGDNGSLLPSISADGQSVAFQSVASNLVVGDTNGSDDIFVHDRLTGETTRVSVDSAGNQGGDRDSMEPSISADGRYVAFSSLDNALVAGDNNAVGDIFVHDRLTGETTRVNVDSAGNQANDFSDLSSITADGRYVAFTSHASNLVAGDNNAVVDVFVHDRQTGQTTRASLDSAGNQGNGDSFHPSISMDGLYVAFITEATNLVPGDTNGLDDIIVHELTLTGPATGVVITPNQASPHPPGTAVLFTASGTGSSGYQYRFWLFDGASWSMVQDYGVGATWSLPASTPVGSYTIAVDVRTSTAVYRDAVAYFPYQIAAAATPATGVNITPDQGSPHPPGTAVLFTASGTGSSGYQYRFWLYDGASWSMVQDYGVGATWSLPASTPVGSYTIAVDVRTSTAVYRDAVAYLSYQIAAAATPATGVDISPDQASPHPQGTAVLFTASGTGSSGYQYRFWLHDGVSWSMVQDYGVGSSWSLPASTPTGDYAIAVDVRTSTAVYRDAVSYYPYQIQ